MVDEIPGGPEQTAVFIFTKRRSKYLVRFNMGWNFGATGAIHSTYCGLIYFFGIDFCT